MYKLVRLSDQQTVCVEGKNRALSLLARGSHVKLKAKEVASGSVDQSSGDPASQPATEPAA